MGYDIIRTGIEGLRKDYRQDQPQCLRRMDSLPVWYQQRHISRSEIEIVPGLAENPCWRRPGTHSCGGLQQLLTELLMRPGVEIAVVTPLKVSLFDLIYRRLYVLDSIQSACR